MTMKKMNLKAEVDINDDGVVVVFNLIKPAEGQSKEFIKVSITPDKITADLNELSSFALQEFQPTKIVTEIIC